MVSKNKKIIIDLYNELDISPDTTLANVSDQTYEKYREVLERFLMISLS